MARNLPAERFETSFQQAEFGPGIGGIIRNLLSFKPFADADIYHVTGEITYLILKLPPAKSVLTIHDLTVLNYRKGLRRWAVKKLLFELPAKRAKYLTVISAATRDELVRVTGCDPGKIRIIENALDEEMTPMEKPPFNVERPNILQVGTTPYKNIPNLVRAIKGLSCTLTIVGDPDKETRRLLEEKKIAHRIEESLGTEAMREEYRKADIVAFCSMFEGFGLPIIEAQAMRTPLVTSNVDPMRSVAGDGALLVDPQDPSDIRRGIESIIRDESLRLELVERGLSNVKRFDPATVAANYAELYEEMVHS
ncbi:MAG TPA: glycosyltransferase family 1 protein [Pyrinomonadaceae bacterium]|nr:glycosyltransferase family 1 protein [Pyrinomonadaceae bacterium]